MPKPPVVEKLILDGPVGALEAVLEYPQGSLPAGSVVVLHPHPQHGGTMHNKVAHTLARAFVRLGYAALRFNFRGTEASEGDYDAGIGELEDALVAVSYLRRWMQDKDAAAPLWLAGFSFGAAIAVRAALVAKPAGLISVAPAVSRFATDLDGQPACPWLVIQGDADELVEVDDTVRWLDSLEPGPELIVIPGAEHFFHGRLIDLRTAITEFVADH